MVRHDARQGHTIEIEGNLAETLAATYPDLGDVYRSEARSLKLVAGARNYRYRHKLEVMI